jgi:hypothetical protein
MNPKEKVANIISDLLEGRNISIGEEEADDFVERIMEASIEEDISEFTLDNWRESLHDSYDLMEGLTVNEVEEIIEHLLFSQDQEITRYWAEICKDEKIKTASKAEQMIQLRIKLAREQWELKYENFVPSEKILGQRFGQLIWNAMCAYATVTSDREIIDKLFYVENNTLKAILTKYINDGKELQS